MTQQNNEWEWVKVGDTLQHGDQFQLSHNKWVDTRDSGVEVISPHIYRRAKLSNKPIQPTMIQKISYDELSALHIRLMLENQLLRELVTIFRSNVLDKDNELRTIALLRELFPQTPLVGSQLDK